MTYLKSFQIQASLKGKTRSKYGNVKTHGFDSKKEYLRHEELKLLERGGEVKDIQTQVPFTLRGENGGKVGVYRADFVYLEKDGTKVIEDVKSPITCTPVFKLKWKLLEDLYQAEVRKGLVKLLINLSR